MSELKPLLVSKLQSERIGFSEIFEAHPDDQAELREELLYQIDRLGLDYADTFRATPECEDIETHLKKQSCCGVFEHRHVCRSGRSYFLGCNYGH